jgi:hypothetical protein
MITAAFTAFSTIGTTIKSGPREDLRGVAILLYSGNSSVRPAVLALLIYTSTELLKDESSEVDLVGPTLPALKSLLDLPVDDNPEAEDKFGRLVHGLLSSCLLNVDEMR